MSLIIGLLIKLEIKENIKFLNALLVVLLDSVNNLNLIVYKYIS